MKVIIAAGGTGGHIYPGIALAEELEQKDPGSEILFIGGKIGPEKTLVQFPIKLINARGLFRKLSWKAFSSPFVSLFGFFEAVKVVREFKPDWVVSMGGYVSLPVVFAAKICRVPVLLHEQNILPGITNRFCSRFAKIVALSFEESLKHMKGIVTGNPVRKKILEAKPEKPKNFTVLIVGGSQGSRSINQKIVSTLEQFDGSGIDLVHVCGTRDYPVIEKKKYPFYNLVPYMYNIEEGLRKADLIVSRAGATAISEILACGKPSVLMPFPYSSEGHQELNARAVEAYGAAVVLHDSELDRLFSVILELSRDKDRLESMRCAALRHSRRDAAGKIVSLLYEKIKP